MPTHNVVALGKTNAKHLHTHQNTQQKQRRTLWKL